MGIMKISMGDSCKRLIVLALTASTVIAPAKPLFAEFLPEGPSAYSFGPEGRPIQDLKEFAKPNEMMSILPNRPIAARDKYGNRLYYTPTGKLAMRVGIDGSMQTSLQGKTIERDVDGNLLRTTEVTKGTNQSVTKNDKGQIIGYQDLAYGGKVVKEYDYQGNQTKTHNYDVYGKNTQFVLNELNQTRTVYGKGGTPAYDLNYEGTQIAWYKYDDKNRLTTKTDIGQNVTFFDNNGNMTLTKDMFSNTLATYNYKKDDEGHWVLDTSVSLKLDDKQNGNKIETVTFYKNGKPQVEKTRAGDVVKDYVYDGQTLRYTFDHSTNATDWFDLNGKTLFTTCNDALLKGYTYSKGAMVASTDYSNSTTDLYFNEQKVFSAAIVDANGNPMQLTAAVYQKLKDMNVIHKIYLKDKDYDQIHAVEIDGYSFIMQLTIKDTGETAKKRLFYNGSSLGLYSWDETNKSMILELGGKTVVKPMEKEPSLTDVIKGIRDGVYNE